MKLQSGHELTPLSDSEMIKMRKDWRGYPYGLARVAPGKWTLPPKFGEFANKIYNFQHRASDVMIMSWPKCGSTWTQEIIWNMRNNPNLDKKEAAAAAPVLVKSPYLEMDSFSRSPSPETVAKSDNKLFRTFRERCPGKDPANGIYFQLTECLPEPRIIKTHLPLSLMAPSMLDRCKVVYIARNPKDVIVSFHHHSRIIKGHDYVGSFEDFVQYFVDDDLVYGPYWLHVKEAWENRDHPNLLFLFYEDMKADHLKEVKKIDAFIGTNLTEEQMNAIVTYTSFGMMKSRGNHLTFKTIVNGKEAGIFKEDVVEEEGGFFRKGEVGDWKNKLTPDLEAKVDEWILKYLEPIDITFKYEV